MNYSWARWVLGYDREQEKMLSNLLGSASPTRIGLFLLMSGGIILALLALVHLRKTRVKNHDKLDRLFLAWCKKLEKYGFSRTTGEGARAVSQRVARQKPELANSVFAIAENYERMRYQSSHIDDGDLHKFKRKIRAFR